MAWVWAYVTYMKRACRAHILPLAPTSSDKRNPQVTLLALAEKSATKLVADWTLPRTEVTLESSTHSGSSDFGLNCVLRINPDRTVLPNQLTLDYNALLCYFSNADTLKTLILGCTSTADLSTTVASDD
ncbi:hypothetical protein L2E82_43434 [Cichorium intybus]|uniref:Uncharacterized protein n=1 Tax=Cichorium intybus TaxID=13427 RepID=A0ACB8ZPI5_CICIN|nr:hypothetical protein L2E82_43434 [Cichorium intybus]